MLHIPLCLIRVLTDHRHGLGATGPAGIHTEVATTVTMDHLAPVAIISPPSTEDQDDDNDRMKIMPRMTPATMSANSPFSCKCK